jgi:hypothetical protein
LKILEGGLEGTSFKKFPFPGSMGLCPIPRKPLLKKGLDPENFNKGLTVFLCSVISIKNLQIRIAYFLSPFESS